MSDALFRHLAKVGGAHVTQRAREAAVADALLGSLFEQQLRAESDPNDYVAVLCPRRSGKSHFAAVKAVRVCLLTPNANVIIIGLVQKSVQRAFWRIIDALCHGNGLVVETNKTDLSFTFENGSYLRLYGAETEDRIERLRGDEYNLAIVDEAKSFSPTVLEYLIHEVLAPAVATRDGKIVMVGTPGHIFAGEFFLSTNPGRRRQKDGKEIGLPVGQWANGELVSDALWSVHRWTMADNVKVPIDPDTGIPKQWLRALLDKQKKGWRDDHPAWRREYLGEWVVNEDGLVYALGALRYEDPARVLWRPDASKTHGLPDGNWSFLLGIDLGYVDATAFVVVAVSDRPQEMRELHSEKHSRLELSGVRDVYQDLVRRFGGFDAVVIDAGAQGLQIHKTLQTDYGVPGIPAEKRDKQGFIQSLNSDIHAGRVKVRDGSPLCEEMTVLSYDLSNGSKEELSRKGTLREDPKQENHCSDAFLYVWRFSQHRWEADTVVEGPTPGTVEWANAQAEADKIRAFERRMRANEERAEAMGLFDSDTAWGANERRAILGGRGGGLRN